MPQHKLLNYLEKVGKGDIAKETPDTSVEPIRNTDKSLISTIDFFYPLVEDPYMQGRIGNKTQAIYTSLKFPLIFLIKYHLFFFSACCNVLSDLYAMGVEKIDTVLMVLGISLKMSEKEREVVTSLMI